jgi:dephospho-CoA kinase
LIVVGLTGSIATGKSAVARAFEDLGAVVIDSDKLAKEALAPGSSGLEEVVARFGQGVLDGRGRLDRPALLRRIFIDRQARADLEAIVHPRVLAAQEEAIDLAREKNPQAVVVVDVPLLFEVGAGERFAKVVVAYCDRQTQLNRLMARNGMDRRGAEEALEAQLDIEDKRQRADYVIDNSDSLEKTRAQVRELYDKLKGMAQKEQR